MESTPRIEDRPSFLLILPDAPSDACFATFQAAYQPALARALSEAADHSKSGTESLLDVALRCQLPCHPAEGLTCRSSIYPHAQHVIALLYGLVCYICTNRAIDLKYDNDVNVRIVLVGNSAIWDTLEVSDTMQLQGPIVNIATLSRSNRPWNRIYSIESEEGEVLLQKLVGARKDLPIHRRSPSFTVERLAGGTIVKQVDSQQTEFRGSAPKGYCHYHVAVGGTFDHLHAGHKLLLTATALILEPSTSRADPQQRSLTIGITGDALLKNKKYAEVLESWEERQEAVYQFLSAIISFENPQAAVPQSERYFNEDPNGKAVHHTLANRLTIKCVEISDPYGPTITDEAITALVVSGETRSGGTAVNEKRREKKWPELEVFEVDVLNAGSPDETASHDNFQGKISSTEIRKRLHAQVADVA